MSPRRRPFALAAAATLLVAAAHFSPSPALIDAATGLPPEGARLVAPLWHLALTPFATLGDMAACSSLPQAASLVFFLLCLVGLFRWAALGHGLEQWWQTGPAAQALAAWLLLVAATLAWGVLWPRSPQRLWLADSELMPVDFHSHTNASWDGRSWFSPRANLDWHARAGFGATFVTDHNNSSGAREARRLSRLDWEAGKRGAAAGLWGEELSLADAHVLLYGMDRPIDPAHYTGLSGLRRFFEEFHPSHGSGLAVPSLPEYYRHHRDRLDELASWGAAGFELIAASPKGLDVPPEFRAKIVGLCRERGLFMTGGSDNHGYGSTACVWSLVRVPGWRRLDPASRERAVLAVLRRDGFSAVRILARERCLSQPAAGSAVWLDAPATLWKAACAWTLAQAIAALVWVWALAAAASRANKVT